MANTSTRARSTPALCSTSGLVPSPNSTVSPRSLARRTSSPFCSKITQGIAAARRARATLRPLSP
jgi:hypothetical protein